MTGNTGRAFSGKQCGWGNGGKFGGGSFSGCLGNGSLSGSFSG